MSLISLVAMSDSEILLSKGEGEDKGESDSKDEAEYEKIEENAYRINDLARLKITFIYRFFFKK